MNGTDDDESESSAWPVALRGVTESVVTTLGPNERWNVAALGLHADDPVTARTYGRTRTRRNFAERGEGYVQFTCDPVDFVDAALAVTERDEPVLESADAWTRVEVGQVSTGTEDGTAVTIWELRPVEASVERTAVPTTNRGYNAVVEATVAASRLDVAAYDRDALLDRLAYFANVVETCGGPREQEAFARLRQLVDADW